MPLNCAFNFFEGRSRMGAHPWHYSVPYVEDMAGALSAPREREFRAGRYYPAEMFPHFPIDANHAPGCRHASIEAARQAAGANGTRSILDILRLGDRPDFGVASSLSDDELEDLFGTSIPSAEEILDCDELFDQIERGHGVYVTAYDQGKPAQIIFLGYSDD
jgi:hypothetical protein